MQHFHTTREPAHAVPHGTSQVRYAIYYTPAQNHPLTKAAAGWFGRSPFMSSGGAMDAVVCEGITIPTSEPRRYGFHATLKPPFRLSERECVDNLEAAIAAFAARTWSCPIGPLRVELLRGFLALVPCEETPRFRAFAASIVEAFDSFRAPMNETELRRRMPDHLTDDETENLVTWGYPYLFEAFRMHFTVTNRIEIADASRARSKVLEHFGPLLHDDFRIDCLSLFEQNDPGSDFVVRRRFPLGGGQVKGTPT